MATARASPPKSPTCGSIAWCCSRGTASGRQPCWPSSRDAKASPATPRRRRGRNDVAAPARSPYRHTQFGWPIAIVTVVGLALALGLTVSLSAATTASSRWLIVALFATIIAGFVLFYALTVEVDDAQLRVRFGVGLIGRRVALTDIARADLVRTKVWWGWGLHLTPSGWLYNVSGRDAVRVEIRGERALIVGSDDAPALKQALDERRAGTPAGPRPEGR